MSAQASALTPIQKLKQKPKFKTKSRGRKIMTIFLIIVAVCAGLILASAAVTHIFFRNELADIEPLGQLVEVNGKMMHVRTMGPAYPLDPVGSTDPTEDDQQTIVLLSGLGTALPSASFGPLMRELSEDFIVATVEYFGVGFSDQTDTPRTNANYVEEIRQALSAAGLQPPYILMPHSASGVYAEYFATRYPDEVTALILLDTTPTHEVIAPDIPKFVADIQRVTQPIGLMRPVNHIVNSTVFGFTEENGYTANEVTYINRFTNHVANHTLTNQTVTHNDAAREVMNMPFPADIPVLSIIPTRPNPGVTEEHMAGHMARFGETSRQITLEGNHMIYHGNSTEIHEAANTFLNELETP